MIYLFISRYITCMILIFFNICIYDGLIGMYNFKKTNMKHILYNESDIFIIYSIRNWELKIKISVFFPYYILYLMKNVICFIYM